MRNALALAMLIVTILPADAAELPQLDPEARCERIAGHGTTMARQTRHLCIDHEQAAYERLKDEWPKASDEDQRQALAMLKRPYAIQDSYEGLEATLKAFVDRRRSAERMEGLRQNNHFHRD